MATLFSKEPFAAAFGKNGSELRVGVEPVAACAIYVPYWTPMTWLNAHILKHYSACHMVM